MHPTNHTDSTASPFWTKNCISLAFDILQWNRFTTTYNKHQQRSASILKLRKRLASNLLTNKHPWLRYVTFVEIVKEGEFVPLNFSISVNLLWFMSSWGDGRMDEINSTLKEQVERLFLSVGFSVSPGLNGTRAWILPISFNAKVDIWIHECESKTYKNFQQVPIQWKQENYSSNFFGV